MSNFDRKHIGSYLQKVNLFFGLAVLTTTFVFLGIGGFSHLSATRATTQIDQLNIQSKKLKDDIESADVSKYTLISLSPVEDFQGMLEAACDKHKCKMKEFQASSDWTPFLSRFAKNSDDPGWLQSQVNLTLTGSTSAITSTLRSVISPTVMFEFDSIDLVPTESKDSTSKVVAKIALRILKKETV